jgi:hypothetical protein
MYTDDFKPITELTPEVISQLRIHPTLSSLRRAIGSHPNHRQGGNQKIPTLFYVKDQENPEHQNEWTIHAIVTDLVRFTLYNINVGEESSSSSSEESYVNSIFQITTPELQLEYVNHTHPKTGLVTVCAQIKGMIPYDIDEECNYIDFIIVPDSSMIEVYGLPKFIPENEGFTHRQVWETGAIIGRLKVVSPDQNSYMNLDWNEIMDESFNPEEFGIELIDCTLQPAY